MKGAGGRAELEWACRASVSRPNPPAHSCSHPLGIVRDLVAAAADACPGALLNIISNPVNSTVPIAAEILKK